MFPMLFSISLDQGKTVDEVCTWEDAGWNWRLSWRRPMFNWESAMEEDLINLLTGKSLCKESKDTLIWNGEHDGVFSVKSAYSTLCSQANNGLHDIFSSLWLATAVPKALFTAWRILLGRLPTFDNLIRRGMVVNSPLCVFCNETQETTQHLFLECAYAQCVWSLCLRWLGISYVQHKDILIHFESFHLSHLNVKQNQVWKGVWVNINRSIWDQRNLVVFKQGTTDAEEIFHLAQLTVWLKLKFGTTFFSYAFSDWILNPSQCLQSCYCRGSRNTQSFFDVRKEFVLDGAGLVGVTLVSSATGRYVG